MWCLSLRGDNLPFFLCSDVQGSPRMFIALGVRSLDLSCAVEIYIWTLIDVSPSQGSYHQLLLPAGRPTRCQSVTLDWPAFSLALSLGYFGQVTLPFQIWVTSKYSDCIAGCCLYWFKVFAFWSGPNNVRFFFPPSGTGGWAFLHYEIWLLEFNWCHISSVDCLFAFDHESSYNWDAVILLGKEAEVKPRKKQSWGFRIVVEM